MENATQLVPSASVFDQQLPDLNQAKVSPIELTSEYWTPNGIGEKRRMFFFDLRTEQSVDMQSGQMIDLMVVYFIEPQPNGSKKVVRQASRRLTAVFSNYSATIKPGMAFEIEYLGKEKNKNNAYFSDRWAVRPIETNR